MTILLLLMLSLHQPIPRLTTEYRQIGPHRTNTAYIDDGERFTFFEATIRDRSGREWVGYGMDRSEAEINAKRHYRDWTERTNR